LSGRVHRVISAVWVLDAGREEHARNITEVTFAALSPVDIDAYLASGEWQGKAGAYAIQGRAAAFVPRLAGSYSGVMGLPLFETVQLVKAFGIQAE
jgi:septum formation protein